ncbi:hypothetical protein PTSG_07884 [Salpingoeca rosetta]|uniref:Uncharacterized protein n=1 Tax=Salpingoeca rosetta (strain ATCC 50818 / BSB-021) TaxID=946362 RepID=F2UGL6_SALR5|nr:uncharacterized protein PTSG_07884 [Salpingoeca rosetta]EGD75766.1 hypothetical protein PTSG_07884 [Salpingoeca rosetta]|eukprot:XP_004991687.1 hypothetical protein PTSG_07884 [Salpingoeca rosetta]
MMSSELFGDNSHTGSSGTDAARPPKSPQARARTPKKTGKAHPGPPPLNISPAPPMLTVTTVPRETSSAAQRMPFLLHNSANSNNNNNAHSMPKTSPDLLGSPTRVATPQRCVSPLGTSPHRQHHQRASSPTAAASAANKQQLKQRPRSKSNTLPANLRPTLRTQRASHRSSHKFNSLPHNHHQQQHSDAQQQQQLGLPSPSSMLTTRATTLSVRHQLHPSDSTLSFNRASRSPAMFSLQEAMSGSGDGQESHQGRSSGDSGKQRRGTGEHSNGEQATARARSPSPLGMQHHQSQTYLSHVISRYIDHFPISRPATPHMSRQRSALMPELPRSPTTTNLNNTPASRVATAKPSTCHHSSFNNTTTSAFNFNNLTPSNRNSYNYTQQHAGTPANRPKAALSRSATMNRSLPMLAGNRSRSSSCAPPIVQTPLTSDALRQLEYETQHLGHWRSVDDLFLSMADPAADTASVDSAPLLPSRNQANPHQRHEDLGLLQIVDVTAAAGSSTTKAHHETYGHLDAPPSPTRTANLLSPDRLPGAFPHRTSTM